MKILNNLTKLPTKNIETLFQKSKVNETFSQSHDMTIREQLLKVRKVT